MARLARALEDPAEGLNAATGEYENLMKERKTLDDEKQNAVTPEQIKQYNQKIVDFNTRIQAYEAKRNAYADQVKDFNERLKAEQQESGKK